MYDNYFIHRGSNRGSNTESVVLSMREFHDTLNLASDRGTSAVNNKKVRLHQRSQARYKNWGNTLEALREKKKQDRLRRMEEIERVQQIIDEKEASYQEAQRRAAIGTSKITHTD